MSFLKRIVAGTTVFEVSDAGVASATGSAMAQGEVAVTGATTATLNRHHVCSGTSADYTVTLPAASGNAGKFVGFRMSTALTKLVTLDGNASETINGATTRVMHDGESALLLCDGSNWFKVAGLSIPLYCQLILDTAGATAQAITTGTVTKVAFTAEVDANAMGDLTADTVTVPRPGKWDVQIATYFNTGMTAVRILNRLFKNTSTEVSGVEGAVLNAGSYGSLTYRDLLVFAAGDVLHASVYHDAGTTQNLFGNGFNRLTVQEVPTW